MAIQTDDKWMRAEWSSRHTGMTAYIVSGLGLRGLVEAICTKTGEMDEVYLACWHSRGDVINSLGEGAPSKLLKASRWPVYEFKPPEGETMYLEAPTDEELLEAFKAASWGDYILRIMNDDEPAGADDE